MTWVTDFFDSATYGTTTSNIGAGMQIYYDKKFLRRYAFSLKVAPLGQKRDIPKGSGKQIQFFRYNDIAVSPSSQYLTECINPNATAITGQNLNATIKQRGAFSQHSSLVKDTHIDRDLAGVTELWGEHAAKLADLLCMQEICANGAYPIRADSSWTAGAYWFEGTFDASSTTTSLNAGTGAGDIGANTDYGDTDDDLNQSIIVITSGKAKGQARAVTDFNTDGTITVSPALDIAPASGDGFVVVSAHGLSTSNKLTTAVVRKAVQVLRNNGATPYDGDMFVGVLCPDTEAGLMADTNWTNVMQYRDSPAVKVNGLFTNEVGEWGGVRWVRTTQPFRFPITTVGTAGSSYGVGANNPGTTYTNYTASGAIYSTPIFGKEAFGVTTLKGSNSDIMKPGIIIKNPGPQDTSNPLNRFSTVGWYLPFVAKALNPLFAVQIWSGA